MRRGMAEIAENALIDSMAARFHRAPGQLNRLHESDAEIVELPGRPGLRLAVTIDAVSEEILAGLYRLPETMGWMAVMASFSDLAAVGAEPLGMVIAVTLPPEKDARFRDAVADGMERACRACGSHILGGDTNAGPAVELTGCAIGTAPGDQLLSRVGCREGESVFVTGGCGAGNALGLVRLAGLPEALFPEESYRPVARLREGLVVRRHASCCMDTSDGLLATVDQLMRLNHVGFRIDCAWERLLEQRVLSLCRQSGTPPWAMTAGPHGEFELLHTIPAAGEDAFLVESRTAGMNPLRIGRVQREPALMLDLPGTKTVEVDFAPVRNLLETVGGDTRRYVAELLAFGQRAGLV